MGVRKYPPPHLTYPISTPKFDFTKKTKLTIGTYLSDLSLTVLFNFFHMYFVYESFLIINVILRATFHFFYYNDKMGEKSVID